MVKLVVIALIVILPAAAAADEPSGARAGARSWLNPNDVFHYRAHTCDNPAGGGGCGPDNLVNNPFTLLLEFDAPLAQPYTIFWILTDTEGNVERLEQTTGPRPAGVNTVVLTGITLPPGSDPFNRGLYKFISIVAGANGKISLSNYYPFRVLP